LEQKGTELIQELLANPVKFAKQGKAYALLQEYFHGYDIDSLRPLLRSDDPYIQSAATFIVSELGSNACALIEDVIPLLDSDNLRIRYECLESIMVCSDNDNFESFIYILLAMEDKEMAIRSLAMYLLSRASSMQIKTVIELFEKDADEIGLRHLRGLNLLLNVQEVKPEIIATMLQDARAIHRKYGAVLAKLAFSQSPELIQMALASDDEDVRDFAEDTVKENDLLS
jgi:hypothetical protein